MLGQCLELSKVREQAIVCFREQMKSMVLKDKSLKKCKVRMALVPLLLHLSNETPSVAKASEEALLAAAKFLGWREVKECIRAQQMWRIPECLVRRTPKGQVGRGLPKTSGVWVSPALLQPSAHSLQLHPCSLSSRTEPPRALLHALCEGRVLAMGHPGRRDSDMPIPLCSPAGSGPREG